MTNADTVRGYWHSAENRDWHMFAATLSPDVLHEAPQTRERVTGREPPAGRASLTERY